jgi:hypothetical protein
VIHRDHQGRDPLATRSGPPRAAKRH